MQDTVWEIMSPREWSYIAGAINAIVWILVFIYYRIKRSRWGLTHTILLLYSSIAVSSLHLFIYYPFSDQMFEEITILPYIYLFVMIMLPLYPIIKLESNLIYSIRKPRKTLFYLVCLSLIFLSFYHIDEIFDNMINGIFMLFVDSDAGLLAYQKGVAKFTTDMSSGDLNKNVDYLSVLANLSRTIVPVFWLYYLSLEGKNKYIFILLTICTLLSPLNSVASGSRYGIVVFIVETTTVFLFMKNFLSQKKQITVKRISSIALVILIVPFFLVTISRNSGDLRNTLYGMERYFSESFINFNNHGLDAGGIRYGDRTMPLFKMLVGFDTAKNYPERIWKYRNMTIDESVFISYVGDFTLDFGPVFSFVLFLLIAIYFRNRLIVRNKELLFHQYILLYVLVKINLGFFLHLFADVFGNVQLLSLMMIYWIFKLDYQMYKRKSICCTSSIKIMTS